MAFLGVRISITKPFVLNILQEWPCSFLGTIIVIEFRKECAILEFCNASYIAEGQVLQEIKGLPTVDQVEDPYMDLYKGIHNMPI